MSQWYSIIEGDGAHAAQRGEPRDACPYREGKEREAWLRGWDSVNKKPTTR